MSFLCYLAYIILIMAPLIRIPLISEYEFFVNIMVAPAFLIIPILPIVVFNSIFRIMRRNKLHILTSVFFQFMFYVCVHVGYLYLVEDGINIHSNKFIPETLGTILGILLFLFFHSLFMNFLLKRAWLIKLLDSSFSYKEA